MDAVHAALLNMDADVAFVDQRMNSQTVVELHPTRTGPLAGSIEAPGVNIDVLNINCAYIRPVETAKAAGAGNVDSMACRRAMLADTALIAWADMCTVPVINRPRSMGANHSKPYQATLIQAHGFLTLRTLITTDPAAARSFIETERTVVYKSVSGVRSIVSRISARDMPDLSDVANCPTQFQQYVEGHDVRVHVIGDRTICTKVVSEASDYRYAHRSGADVRLEPTDIDAALAARCVQMTRAMGLHLAGIDFRVTAANEWYCLEVNPSPGFTFYQAATEQPISKSVASLLCRGGS
jgi:glutathione synthase/RimK-type ligase-like ATP-grasp enzyme